MQRRERAAEWPLLRPSLDLSILGRREVEGSGPVIKCDGE